MIEIHGRTMNEAIHRSCQLLLRAGHTAGHTRNAGQTLYLNDVQVTLENPRARHLWLKGRRNNIYAAIAETFWVLAGKEKIAPYLEFFVPRAKDYSDDGVTWHDAYGPRLYGNSFETDQLVHVLDSFENDGPQSRRAVISLWDPSRDTVKAGQERYGTGEMKAVPCNNMLYFYVGTDVRLHMKVVQRSADLIWGLSHVNMFEWTVLQELVLHLLHKELDWPLGIGAYHHNCVNLHLYEGTEKQAKAVVGNGNANLMRVAPCGTEDLLFGELSCDTVQGFFQMLVGFYTGMIGDDSDATGYRWAVNHGLPEIFKEQGVPTENNRLFSYACAVAAYIRDKKGDHVGGDRSKGTWDNDFTQAVTHTRFGPWRNNAR